MRKHLKDYFVPHEGNGYKPHSLQKAALVGMLGMILLSFTVANIQSLLWIGSDWMVSTILPAVIVDLTNEEREDDALSGLKRNELLDEAARLKAEDMAKNEYFAHYSPDGVTPWHWFGEVSYNYVHAGENLAVHFTDSGDVVDAWMDSPTHRANIMNGDYTEIGVGSAEGEYEGFKTIFVVQLFGTPAGATLVEEEIVIVPEEEVITSPEAALASSSPVSTGSTTVLAESVELTETVEVIDSDPVLVEVSEEATSSEQFVASTTDMIPVYAGSDFVPSPTYESFISTSTGGAPATIAPTFDEADQNVPFSLRLFTQPHAVLQILYMFIASLVFVSLLLSIGIEVQRQQPLQIAYGLALMLIMYGLFEIHTVVSGGALIL